jgi:predicted RNA-binding Zn ribbon-like protein
MVDRRETVSHVHPDSAASPSPGFLAVDFANTVACPSCRVADALSSAAEYNRWLRGRRDLSIRKVQANDVGTLRRFRADVRALLSACVSRTPPPASSLARVNRARERAAGWNDLMWHRERWMIMERGTMRPAADRNVEAVAQSITDLLVGPDRTKLRACQGPGCSHFLLARTRQQIWCSPTGCGNRVRAARHWRKVKAFSARRTASD